MAPSDLTQNRTLQSAFQHHQAGRLSEAEKLYRQILKQNPTHPEALHFLGLIAAQVLLPDNAIDMLRQAIAAKPDYADAYSNLGNLLKDQGRLDEAIAAHRQAIALEPALPEAHYNLGVALEIKGRRDEALAAYRQALSLRPGYSQAQYNLGVVLEAEGQRDQAMAAYRQTLALNPDFPDAHYNLANLLRDNGQLDEAIAAFRQAIAFRPNFPAAYVHIGNGLINQGRLDDAVAAYRQALVLKPDLAEARYFLGVALAAQGRLDEALSACRQALILKSDFPEAHYRIGLILEQKGQLDDALAAYRQALALDPKKPEMHNTFGILLKDTGQLDAAIAEYRQALAIEPDLARPQSHLIHSNLIFALQYHPASDAQAIAEELRHWNRRHAQPLQKSIPTHANSRAPERRLRIGYVSPDFRRHAVAQCLVPLFSHHDKRTVEIFAYANVLCPDDLTDRLRASADSWRDISRLSDDQAADLIHHDGIDILVDLALHTGNNRLLIFARKPAPLQVTFAGYPGSTGMPVINYRLSDPYLDPPGMDDSIYCEQTLRLPDSFWCFDPLDDRDLSVSALPALTTGSITFGCLNNPCKINDSVLVLWARVLRQIEGSRLLLMAYPGAHRQRTVARLNQEGIAPHRVEFVTYQPRRPYLQEYHRIDIGLDTFPYNGHTTSLDSFWMGVPVVTSTGQRAVARAGWCQLSNLGLPELAGHSPEEFVRIAVALAHDLPRLRHLRSTLRQRLEQSPLMDAPRYARNIEAAYRLMWRQWCAAH